MVESSKFARNNQLHKYIIGSKWLDGDSDYMGYNIIKMNINQCSCNKK